MTNIRLVYNPFTEEVCIYIENEVIAAAENKIYTFLNANRFQDCLLPFNKRYVIWEGLLLELLNEVNDEELHITFEGQEADFRLLEEAFHQLEPAVENAGYENKWRLIYRKKFETANVVEKLTDVAHDLREMCESRMELMEIDNLIAKVKEENVYESCRTMKTILSRHCDKWEQSTNMYRQEKISYLKMLESGLEEVQGRAGKR